MRRRRLRVSNVTDVTGTTTVITAVRVIAPLSLVAVIVAVPAEIPRTLPFGSTVATEGLFVAKDTPRKVALDGVIVAERLSVAPTFIVAASLLSLNEVTGLASAETVTRVSARLVPSAQVAVMRTVPARTPLTTPFSTVAMLSFAEAHCKVSGFASVGRINGTSLIVCPTGTPAVPRKFSCVIGTGGEVLSLSPLPGSAMILAGLAPMSAPNPPGIAAIAGAAMAGIVMGDIVTDAGPVNPMVHGVPQAVGSGGSHTAVIPGLVIALLTSVRSVPACCTGV